MKKINLLLLLIVTVASIYLRWYLLNTRGYVNDINLFLSWGNEIKNNGFWSLYSPDYFKNVDYPPLIPLVSSWWFAFGNILHLAPAQLFKILPTLSEMILLAITATYVIKSKFEYKNILLAIILLQPGMALVTSSWGQVDSILVLFMLLGFLLIEKKPYLATFLVFLSFLVKPQAMLGMLVFALFILFRKGFKEFLKQAGFFILLILIVELIFKLNGTSFLPTYFMSTNRYPYLSMNAFNLWWLTNGPASFGMSDAGQGFSAKAWGLTYFAVFLAPAIFYLFNKVKKIPELLLVNSYIYLIFFIFPTQIHERYLYPAVAFLAFSAILNKKIFSIYLILSLTLLLNCFAVLENVFPQFNLAFVNSSTILGGDWTRIVSLVNVIVTLYLAIYFTYESFKKK